MAELSTLSVPYPKGTKHATWKKTAVPSAPYAPQVIGVLVSVLHHVAFSQDVLASVQLPGQPLSAESIRYCGIPSVSRGGDGDPVNHGEVTVLSIWNADRDIVNVHFEADEVKSAVKLLHAVTRLIFESNEKSDIRTHKFCLLYDGFVDVSTCSVEDRDARDVIKQKIQEAAKAKKTGTDFNMHERATTLVLANIC